LDYFFAEEKQAGMAGFYKYRVSEKAISYVK